MYTPTCKGYFSGCGGAEIGLMQSGIRVIQSLDLDRDATDCMRLNSHYFGHSIINKDIKDLTVKEQERSDIIAGTYPCTKYSTAADINSTRTGDDLFLHFFRHTAIEQPEVYWLENVPGMKKFKVVMEAMTQLPNYYVTVFCPVAATNWLPQKRDRLIIIGTRKPFMPSHPGVSNCRPRLKDLMEINPKVDMPDYIHSRINGKYRDAPIIVDPENSAELAPTCVAHYSKDMGTRLVKDPKSRHGVRPFTIREYARLQGFPDDYHFPDKRSSYKLIGNAVPPPMGRWVGGELMKYFN